MRPVSMLARLKLYLKIKKIKTQEKSGQVKIQGQRTRSKHAPYLSTVSIVHLKKIGCNSYSIQSC